MDLVTLQRETLALSEEIKRQSNDDDKYRAEQLTVEFLLAMLRLRPFLPEKIDSHLDIGCGSGYSLLLWSQLARESVGVDLKESIDTARVLFAALPPHRTKDITLVESTGEDVHLGRKFDVITTQYVLEHVRDIEETLRNLKTHLAADGLIIHTLPSSVSRSNWYMEYRQQRSPAYRLAHSLYRLGVGKTLRNPASFTPPHEPRFGDFQHEMNEYRIDRWAVRIYRAGFSILDYFQTEDINWVIVTKIIGPQG